MGTYLDSFLTLPPTRSLGQINGSDRVLVKPKTGEGADEARARKRKLLDLVSAGQSDRDVQGRGFFLKKPGISSRMLGFFFEKNFGISNRIPGFF